MKRIVLRKNREQAVQRFHPWVFSGAVYKIEGQPSDGDIVEVVAHDGRFLAIGHYQNGSILVRIISFTPSVVDLAFWQNALQNALEYRKSAGILDLPHTNCYRLVHAAGDGLPGLIIDIYNDTAVVQCHSIGMYRNLDQIAEALRLVLGDRLTAVFSKSAESLPTQFAAGVTNGYVWGTSGGGKVEEYGHQFRVDWEGGQKTGFFLDQRDNRLLLAKYAPGKKVLNAFCYTGGFSIYALKAGASQVDSVDISAKAMAFTDENVQLNDFDDPSHRSFTADVLKFLQNADSDYDIMVVDPPAFAKSLKKRHNAVMGYKRLNARAMQKIKKGGILFTFSCSQVVSRQLFQDTIVAAAIEAGRRARVMHHLSQPPDHPVSLFHPEGNYLKGLVVYIE